jgi:hypothetical protein
VEGRQIDYRHFENLLYAKCDSDSVYARRVAAVFVGPYTCAADIPQDPRAAALACQMARALRSRVRALGAGLVGRSVTADSLTKLDSLVGRYCNELER